MEIKGKICFVFLLFVVSATLSFADHQGIIFAEKEQGVRKIVAQCHQSCQGSQGEKLRPECFQSCMQAHFQGSGKGQSGETYRPETTDKRHHQQSNNPYVFQEQDFTTRLETENGYVMFLKKFTQQSELFKGIEKYRAAFLEAEPQTFIQPNHWDADALAFVVNGQGILTLIEGNSRKSHNIKQGDLFRVPAGINAYLINTDDNQKLVLAKILHSLSVLGELQFFSGGGNADSFFNVFSREVLEAAFDVEQQSIGRVFGQQKGKQEMFKKATPEQIQSFAGEDKGRSWPFGDRKEKNRHTSIYRKDPTVANDNGILHEVNSQDFPDLEDINVAFSFFNITRGSMAGPFYNTKTTLVLMVSKGVGRFEMACPHLSEQRQGFGGGGEIHPRYEQVSSELRRGTVVVIPAGHPVVIEAFGEQNLEVAGFGLNSDENEWFPLVGRDNVMSQWEDAALELTFGSPSRDVQRVIQKQNQKLFFKAPVRGGRAFA